MTCKTCTHYSNPKNWAQWFKCDGTTMKRSAKTCSRYMNAQEDAEWVFEILMEEDDRRARDESP